MSSGEKQPDTSQPPDPGQTGDEVYVGLGVLLVKQAHPPAGRTQALEYKTTMNRTTRSFISVDKTTIGVDNYKYLSLQF